MSWFMSAIYDRFMKASEEACLDAWRKELLSGLRGTVLEIGAGTGANLRHYPSSVTRLALTEPDRHMFAKLARRTALDRAGRVELYPAPVDALPFDDVSFDAVVCTLVLCSVENQERALAEIHRVLKPGASFVFLEHVAAHDRSRLAWQRRVEPFWKRISGNCHLTRDTSEAIRASGLVMDDEKRESMRKALPIVRPTIRGIARKPRTRIEA